MSKTSPHYRRDAGRLSSNAWCDLARASVGRPEHFLFPPRRKKKTFHRGSTDYFVNARARYWRAFYSPYLLVLPVGEVLNVAKDYL
ncbi:hypothetical protein KCP77_14365 [Salmonella enterica subsp. enterica]|nr:hypothetical protein KCP77_14365 [Salmonella enterica subsp. enterica]